MGAQLGEADAFGNRERGVAEVEVRVATPQRECLVVASESRVGVADRPRLLDEGVELLGVEVAEAEVQPVPVALGDQHRAGVVTAQVVAEAGDVAAQRPERTARCRGAPEIVDQGGCRADRAGPAQHRGEHSTARRTADRDRRAVVMGDLKPAQHPEPHIREPSGPRTLYTASIALQSAWRSVPGARDTGHANQEAAMFRSDELDETTQPAPMRPRRWFTASRRRLLVVGALLATAGGTAGAVAAQASDTPTPNTPNRCIQLNGGDYNACNVGNTGRGDLPYRSVTTKPYTPNDCIRINGGDYNACNVGNTGRGDLPYRPVH